MKRDIVREKQDQRFREHIISALTQPRKSPKITPIINSPLFLWILTAAFLTVGGAYLTRMQECVSSAEQAIERRSLLETEMDLRRDAISHLVEAATSVDEIRSGLLSVQSFRPELKDKSLFDISAEYVGLNKYVDESGVAEIEKALSCKIKPIKPSQFIRYYSLYTGSLNDKDPNLDDLKDFVRKYFYGDHIRSLVHTLSRFRPSCSARGLLTDAVQGTKAAHIIQESDFDPKVMETICSNPDIDVFDFLRIGGPALRPPFVKMQAPSAQEIAK